MYRVIGQREMFGGDIRVRLLPRTIRNVVTNIVLLMLLASRIVQTHILPVKLSIFCVQLSKENDSVKYESPPKSAT